VTRTDLGLPENWEWIENWLNDFDDTVQDVPDEALPIILKNPEIPSLNSYVCGAPTNFWAIFPENFEKNLKSTVKTKVLKKLIQKCWFSWTLPQKRAAKLTLRRLQGLVPISFNKHLLGIKVKNTQSAIDNGRYITDAICSWVKKGYVAGPFRNPPFKDFRSNPLMAAVQKTKVRPILNVSSPKGNSLNDAIDIFTVEKISMSSPRLFAEELLKAGKGALFSKSDIVDAYKLIPNAVEQYRLFGFRWLNRYFYDKTKVFGSKEAPASFDSLPETIVNIICTLYKIPKSNIQRQLDDVPMVSGKDSGLTEKFSSAYQKICNSLNIPLASDCPKHEKAFGPSTYGTVLGVQFDSLSLKWSLSKEKVIDLKQTIEFFIQNKTCTLKQVQKLHGKLFNFAHSMDLMKSFKFNLLSLLNKFKGQEGVKIIPEEVKRDLLVWKKCISDSEFGFPIRGFLEEPPLFPIHIISDAAGAALEWVGGKSVNKSLKDDRGVASILYHGRKVIKTSILSWPSNLLMGMKNREGTYFGTKSGTLEAIGLILPFISYPQDLRGQHIVLEVDNTSLAYGWEKHYSKKDPETSLLLRVLHVIEVYLSCRIYVRHVKRCSNTMAKLVDQLSRKSSTTQKTFKKIECSQKFYPTRALYRWLQRPDLDWSLPEKIVSDIKSLLAK